MAMKFIFQGHQVGEAFCKIVKNSDEKESNEGNLAAPHSNNQRENPGLAQRFVKS
jgi:hypothetical protein